MLSLYIESHYNIVSLREVTKLDDRGTENVTNGPGLTFTSVDLALELRPACCFRICLSLSLDLVI